MAVLLLFFITSCWCAFASRMMPMAMAAPLCAPQNPEVSALLAFKAALSCYLPSNCTLSTWELPSVAPCVSNISHPCTHWAGITCRSHHVVALNLSHSHLQGTLSPSLAQLPFLRSLDLSFNHLMGRIPMELGNCSSLITLFLQNNFLQGQIPPQLGMLNKLQVLNLGFNTLTGVVPGAIANCTALRALALYSNQLSGRIPEEMGTLKKLQTLVLWSNQLTGGIPNALGNCTSLANLQLHNNNLSGRIPMKLGMLNELQFLDLCSNELSGGIPITLANCTSLTGLSLDINFLSGQIPSELAMLKELQMMILSRNELTEGIPSALGNCTSLRHLELVMNHLSERIPVELGMLSKLKILRVWGNRLTGGIPNAFANCTSLIHLQLAANDLSGSIPEELGMLSSLQTFSVEGNDLSGSFPPTLANCTALEALAVGVNSLSGTIPDVFDSLSSLGGLDLSENSFTGVLPRSLGGLKKLDVVRVDGNALVGTIPDNFLSSPLLTYLNISYNNLSGVIPESFGTLSGLVELDLSHNQLSGKIPPSLGSLLQLVFLDFSWNSLSGGIPVGLQGALELQLLDLSHNNLTGTLPSSFASLQSLLLLDLSYNQLDGPIPNAFPYSSTSALVDLRGNPLLCGGIVNRSCAAMTDRGTSQRRTKLLISVVGAFFAVALLMIGIVIIWRDRRKRSQQSTLNNHFRTDGVKVSAEKLHVATDGFSKDRVLGQGGVSIVYSGTLKGQDVPVAIKVLKSGQFLQSIAEAQVVRLKKEVEVLAMVRHRNIVKVLGCCFNLDVQAIVLELMPNGNLDAYLHGTSRKNALSKEAKLRLLLGIAQGLEYLHHWHDPGRSIVHCDVKPANILLGEDWEPRIADFGIAKLLQIANNNVQSQQDSVSMFLRGSVGYIPPEYAYNAEVSTAGDVYSFGVVMLEVLTGKRPTDVENEADGKHGTLMSLVQAAYPQKLVPLFWDETSPGMGVEDAQALARVALSCTSRYPVQRPTMFRVTSFLSKMANPSTDSPLPPLFSLTQ